MTILLITVVLLLGNAFFVGAGALVLLTIAWFTLVRDEGRAPIVLEDAAHLSGDSSRV